MRLSRSPPAADDIEFDLVAPDDPPERRAAKLARIAAALIGRAERGTGEDGSGYGLFQRATALEDEVRARTRDLERVLGELNSANAELAAATAAAEAANRAKTRFLAAASHDILQPLSAAKLFLGSLSESGLDPGQRRMADNLGHAFASLESLLRDLLEISRLDTPSVAADIASLPIAEVLEPLALEFAPIAAAKGLRFRTVASTARVLSDRKHLRRIAQNLIANAVQHTSTGQVVVGCRRRGECLRLDVVDTGPGIPEEKLADIFREFHRLADDPDDTLPRAGLGLAIVERTCKLLGVQVEIASAPGRGSRFSIALPLADAPARPATAPLEDWILLLVGGAAATGEIGDLAESAGASVLKAANLQEAAVVSSQLGLPPDAVVVAAPAAVAGVDEWTRAPSAEAVARALGAEVPVMLLAAGRDLSTLPAELLALRGAGPVPDPTPDPRPDLGRGAP